MKLKKHISIILSALVLFSNIGLMLNVHFCHGQVSSVAVTYKSAARCEMPKEHHKKACCAVAEKATKKSCCKHGTVKLEDKSDKTLVKSLQLDLGTFYVSEAYNEALFVYNAPLAIQKDTPAFYTETNAPPLYKLYCQYVLYA